MLRVINTLFRGVFSIILGLLNLIASIISSVSGISRVFAKMLSGTMLFGAGLGILNFIGFNFS